MRRVEERGKREWGEEMGMSEAGGDGPRLKTLSSKDDPLAIWTNPISCLSLRRSLSFALSYHSRSCCVQPSRLRNATSAPAPCCVLPPMSVWPGQSTTRTARQPTLAWSGRELGEASWQTASTASTRSDRFEFVLGGSFDFVDFKAARRFAISRFDGVPRIFVLSCHDLSDICTLTFAGRTPLPELPLWSLTRLATRRAWAWPKTPFPGCCLAFTIFFYLLPHPKKDRERHNTDKALGRGFPNGQPSLLISPRRHAPGCWGEHTNCNTTMRTPSPLLSPRPSTGQPAPPKEPALGSMRPMFRSAPLHDVFDGLLSLFPVLLCTLSHAAAPFVRLRISPALRARVLWVPACDPIYAQRSNCRAIA